MDTLNYVAGVWAARAGRAGGLKMGNPETKFAHYMMIDVCFKLRQKSTISPRADYQSVYLLLQPE